MIKFFRIFAVFITIFLITFLSVDVIDTLMSVLRGDNFLFALYIGSFYLIVIFILLILLSLSLRKSEIKWQKVLGNIGIFVVAADLVVNAIAFFGT